MIGGQPVAVAVAHHLSAVFDGAVSSWISGMWALPIWWFLGVASMLGLAVGSDDTRPSLIADAKRAGVRQVELWALILARWAHTIGRRFPLEPLSRPRRK
jgi:hypothetical protein